MQAAENGSADAQFHLAHYLEHGEYGFESDSSKARIWFMKKAVEQEYPEALYVYSLEFLDNRDRKKFLPRAIELLTKAASQDFEPAKELLNELVYRSIN